MQVALFVALAVLVLASRAVNVNLTLVKTYAGPTFFDDWDFYGDTSGGLVAGPWNGRTPFDDTNNGDTFYMGRVNGSGLYRVDRTTDHAFIQVNNTGLVPDGQKRESIRIATKDFFNYGTLWVIDAYHLPWGCSVWPAIWTAGTNWPNNGEIDIVEGYNKMTANQMTLHTSSGCSASQNSGQTSKVTTTDCSQGCSVSETKPGSYGPLFTQNDGGVWAAQFDVGGIFIWFWPRDKVPTSITSATDSVDVFSFGTPSAAFPSSNGCQIADHFGPQQLVIDVTLCGDLAGNPDIYAQTCDDTPPLPVTTPPLPVNRRCYIDNIVNSGNPDYATAFFEIGSIRVFSANATAMVSPDSPAGPALSPGLPPAPVTTSSSPPAARTTGASIISANNGGSRFFTPNAVCIAALLGLTLGTLM